jgi:hypothetical protein
VSNTISDPQGLKTAAASLHDPAAVVPGTEIAQQLDLLPLPLLPASCLPVVENYAIKVSGNRGAGRPAGSINRNTKEWREYILQRYQSPLIAMAETYSRPTEVLAKELGCSKLEAFNLQQKAAADLAPYVHQKMPMAIEAGEGGLINLIINTGSPEKTTDFPTIEIIPMETSENSHFDAGKNANANETNANETAQQCEKQSVDVNKSNDLRSYKTGGAE